LKDPNHTIPIRQLRQYYTQDQKEAFIGYIINDKMSIKAASKKAKMNLHGAKSYYRRHFKQQNPDIARPRHIVTLKRYTQKQIKGLISYIVDDKMPIRAASRKANFSRETARKYYQRYLNDNNMEIPVSKMGKHCTQDQINELVVYIVDDKMTVKAASKKANMAENSGQKYYHQYLKDRNVDGSLKNCCTQEQINELIDYIVDDRMSIRAASKKANLTYATSHRYYRQYANDQKLDTPTRSPRVDSARKNK
jgi:hypothetical protein